jgi:transposase-like protein
MKRRKPEQIVTLLHQVDAALGQGKTIEDICREQGISPATYHRWKQKYGGLSIQDAKRLKELEMENAKLKRLLAESMLANDALREFLSKKV